MTTTRTIPSSISVSQTHSLKFHFAHQWIIHDFSFFNVTPRLTHPNLFSMPFSHPDNPSMEFFLQLHPHGFDNQCSDFISLFLFYKYSGDQEEATVNYKFSVIYAKNRKQCSRASGPMVFVPGGNGSGWNRYMNRIYCFDKANDVLYDDQLTIFCEVNVLTTRYNIGNVQIKRPPTNLLALEVLSIQQVSTALGTLFENGRYTDLVLVVGQQQEEIRVHKSVLIARSPVFAAMFEHDTQESRENRVSIPDLSTEVGEQFVRFLYTGKVTQLDKYAQELLIVADKYGTELLKQMSSHVLATKITLETVIDCLIFADQYSAIELKQCCLEYIIENVEKVMASEEWKQLINSQVHCVLLSEIFQSFVLKTSESSDIS